MAKVSGVHKPFGTIVRIKGEVEAADLEQLETLFTRLTRNKNSLFLDLGKMGVGDGKHLDRVLSAIKRYAKQGLPITLVQAHPDIREAIRAQRLDRYVTLSDFLDEAIFPSQMDVRPKIDENLLTEPIKEVCPSCDRLLQHGEDICRHCGLGVIPRRKARHSISIPFLYGSFGTGEFLGSDWKGGVTEDLDLNTFSGIGFYCRQELAVGNSVFFLFPTLQWELTPRQPSILPIFHGRVKHAARAGDWFRLGVALCDMYEFSGRLNVAAEEEELENQ
ncbi:MAG: hypothetical protein C4527_00630 [Candidatus Omnitrophota bacterium]|jgi:anti-anti-sigma regulatory factor|nr:MAG: hypothetical protein C4527_00630 [Candidatus Omnitrophota bacterium]